MYLLFFLQKFQIIQKYWEKYVRNEIYCVSNYVVLNKIKKRALDIDMRDDLN